MAYTAISCLLSFSIQTLFVIDVAWQSVLYGIYNPESRGRSPRARVVYSIQHVTAMLHLISNIHPIRLSETLARALSRYSTTVQRSVAHTCLYL